MKVAVIPARGGSKRIPRKNIKEFAGRPMITYPIRAAKASGLFDRIVVSTDSDEIARIAREAGAEVPFMRPKELSDDHTATAPVLAHAMEALDYKKNGIEFFCGIYPTAPFLDAEYLKKGFEALRSTDATVVTSITTFPFPIFRGVKRSPEGRLEMFWPEHAQARSNDLPHAYHDAGQFYWIRTSEFMKAPNLWPAKTYSVVLPRYLVQDIDTPEDWEVAERMYRGLHA